FAALFTAFFAGALLVLVSLLVLLALAAFFTAFLAGALAVLVALRGAFLAEAFLAGAFLAEAFLAGAFLAGALAAFLGALLAGLALALGPGAEAEPASAGDGSRPRPRTVIAPGPGTSLDSSPESQRTVIIRPCIAITRPARAGWPLVCDTSMRSPTSAIYCLPPKPLHNARPRCCAPLPPVRSRFHQ